MKCIGQVIGGFKSVTFLNVKSPNLRAKSNLSVFCWSTDGKLRTKEFGEKHKGFPLSPFKA